MNTVRPALDMGKNSGARKGFLFSKPALLWCIVAVIAFACITVLLSYHLGADLNWDLLNYHFYNGYLYTHGKLFSDSLAMYQSYLDPLLNSFYYVLISSLSPLCVNLILATLQSFALSSVFFLSIFMLRDKPTWRPFVIAAVIAGAAIEGPDFWSEIGGTMGDILLSTPIIVALLLLIRYLRGLGTESPRTRYVAIAGLFVGFVSGLKFTNLVYALAMFLSLGAILLISKHVDRWRALATMAIFALTSAAAFLLIYGHIGSLLWQHYRNPIFPYFNDIFRSPDLSPYAFHDERWFPKTLGGYAAIPFTYLTGHEPHAGGLELRFRTAFFAVIFTLLIPYIWRVNSSRRCVDPYRIERIFFLLFFVIAFMVWAWMFSYYRYLAVLELLSPLALYLILDGLVSWRSIWWPVVMVAGVACFDFPHPNWGREPYGPSYFGVQKASLQSYRHSLLIVGHAPMGFVLPYFPGNVKIMSLPEEIGGLTPAFQVSYMAPLKTFRGPIYYLVAFQHSFAASVARAHPLTAYGLQVSDHCKKLVTNAYPIAICHVSREQYDLHRR